MLPFLCCSTRYRSTFSPTGASKSMSILFSEVFDALRCSMLNGPMIGLSSSSNDENLLCSKKEEEVVVVPDDAPVVLSKWSSSDDKSKLVAKGTECESDATTVSGSSTSSSWSLMGLMADKFVSGGANGDGDFFDRFSNVLTNCFKARNEKKKTKGSCVNKIDLEVTNFV